MTQTATNRARWNSAQSQFLKRWVRRAVTIGAVSIGLILITVLFPLLAAIALLRDAMVPCKRATIRTLLFAECLLTLEFSGIGLSFVIWLLEAPLFRTASERFIRRNYRLQNWWGCQLAKCAQRIYGIQLDISGLPAQLPRAFALFVRHSSFADAFLPLLLVSSRFGARLRYVMKEELLWDPCVDIVGHRIPNAFIERESDNSNAQIGLIRNLATGLGPGDGILIYPEGTRFTREKQRRILERLRAKSETVLKKAKRFRSVLPPRLAGSMAILEEASDADALFCAHSGFSGATTLWELLSGNLVGKRVYVHFWLVPAREIPRSGNAMQQWFLEQWAVVDSLVTDWNQESAHA